MGRIGSILCTIVAMFVPILLFYSPNYNHNRNRNHNHRCRHCRLLMFHSDHNQSEKQHHIPHFHVDFEVTNKIVHLFPEIDDVNPSDWFVSLDELTQRSFQQVQREMEFHDKDHDGFVSFAESGPPSWIQEEEEDADSYDNDDCWWKEEHFNASDADGDGFLNLIEFNDFLNPAESKNPKLQQWLCKAEIRERDTDRDGKVNFKEFFHGLFDLVRSHDEESHNDSHHSDDSMYASARVLFSQLDKDGDGYLSDVELLPIIGKVHPSWHHFAKQQAEYIISRPEDDKDGRLSVIEMIKHPYLFYSAIFNNDKDEYDDSHVEVF